jgi:hypothetical protein
MIIKTGGKKMEMALRRIIDRLAWSIIGIMTLVMLARFIWVK